MKISSEKTPENDGSRRWFYLANGWMIAQAENGDLLLYWRTKDPAFGFLGGVSLFDSWPGNVAIEQVCGERDEAENRKLIATQHFVGGDVSDTKALFLGLRQLTATILAEKFAGVDA